MNNRTSLNIFSKNQDLFRGSVKTMDKQTLAKALLWLKGEASFPYPTSIHLHLTLRCTARCLHCKQWTWPKHSEFTIKELDKLFEIFNSWGVKTITLGGGNPLLYEHIKLTIQRAFQANIQVGIITEGINLSHDLSDAICQYAHWIRFSLDGPNAKIHDKIRNSPGLFNKVITSIKKLQAQQSNLRIGLNCVVQKNNLRVLSQMIDLAEDIGVDALLFKIPHGEDHSGHFLPSMAEWKQFKQWMQITATEKRTHVKTNLNELCNLIKLVINDNDVVHGKPVLNFYVKEDIRCFAPLFFLTCNSEGDMYPCDYLQADTRLWGGKYGHMRRKFYLGNVLENPQQILDKLAIMLREQIHNFPTHGYDECGCCTRFCQLNTLLSKIYQEIKDKDVNEQSIIEYLSRIGDEQTESKFL